MAETYIVFVTVKNAPPKLEIMSAALYGLKDWFRVTPGFWLVLTSLSMTDVRDRLYDKLKDEDPTILVLKFYESEWAVYASETLRKWIRSDHANQTGE